MIDKNSVNKILVIKLRGIGDVVLSTIVLDNLKVDFPKSTIDYLTDAPCKPGLEGLHQINKVHVFPRNSLLERLKMFLKIRSIGYDLVIDLFSNPATAQLTFFSGAKYRIGFPYRARKYAYNYYGPEERGIYHTAILHLMLLKNAGLNSSIENLYYYLDKRAQDVADKYFIMNNLNNYLVIGISPSGGWPSKKCDPEKLALIGNTLKDKYNGIILILWGPSDKDDAVKISNSVPGSLIAPDTSIKEMAAFINKCSLLIANDSGPMHISTAVGTPVLSLHGPTDPRLQGPFGEKHEWVNYAELDCIICNLLACPKNHECFKYLPIQKIIEKVDILIEKNNIKVPH